LGHGVHEKSVTDGLRYTKIINRHQLYPAPAPESSKQGWGKKSFRGHMTSVEPETTKVWSSRRQGSRRRRRRGDGEWGRGIPFPSRLGGLWATNLLVGWWERRKMPQRGPGHSPSEKRLYCFLSASERLSLQRVLKINVVHNRTLIEKKMGFAQ